MNSGAKDKYVEIQQIADVAAPGFPVETATHLAYAYMQRKDLSATETFKASQLSSPFETIWLMHYQPNMDPDAVNVPKTRRLRYLNRVYDIVGAVNVGRRSEIELRTLAGGLVT